MKVTTLCAILSVGFLLLVHQTGSAQLLDPADWSNTFALEANGEINPGVLVGFNPQPEIPASPSSALDLSDPNLPTVRVPDSSVSDGHMRILFAVDPRYSIVASDTPSDGNYQFFLRNPAAETLTVEFDIETESGGIPNEFSWIMFNPQPEPPAIFSAPGEGPGPDVGFEFDFTFNSPATLAMRVLDSNGRALQFRVVPEPSSWLLVGMGTALLSVFRHKRGE